MPLIRNLVPSWAPLGMLNRKTCDSETLPSPAQVLHRFVKVLPEPLHCGHGRMESCTNGPICCLILTWPAPLHSEHSDVTPSLAPVPLQS